MATFNLNMMVPEHPKALIVIQHGFAEHGGRYAHEAEFFLSHHYAVVRIDAREHGQNTMKMTQFQNFVDDLVTSIEMSKRDVPNVPVILWGHSMGGLISTITLQQNPNLCDGLILSGPAIGTLPAVSGIKKPLLKFMNMLVPNMKIKDPIKDPVVVNDAFLKRYDNDPLLLNETRVSFMYQFLIQGQRMVSDTLSCPLLLVGGEADQIVPIALQMAFYDQLKCPNKSIRVFPEMGLELTNEPAYLEVLQEMDHFIRTHVIK